MTPEGALLPEEFHWVKRSGRNRDGDRFDAEYLADASSRIWAWIEMPHGDEPFYNVGTSWREAEFLDYEPAKMWCEVMAREVRREEAELLLKNRKGRHERGRHG